MLSEMSQPSPSIVFQPGPSRSGIHYHIVRGDSQELSSFKCINSSALFAHSDSDLTAGGGGNAHQIVTASAFKLKIKLPPSLCIINGRRTLCDRGETRLRASAAN